MSEKKSVPYGDNPSETATLLLAAADDLDLDAGVVETTSDAVFRVPDEVAKKAGLDTVEDEQPVSQEVSEAPEKQVKRSGRRASSNDKEPSDD